MIDILEHLNAVQREVGRTGETVSLKMRRTYRATPAELWDALTDPARLARWFWPTTGDFQVGGSFQLQDMAGGEVLECEPPQRFKVSYGGPNSLLEIRLQPAPDNSTELELEHVVTDIPAPGAGGALYVGPGWDGGLLGLALYVAGLPDDHDPVTFADSPEMLQFNEQSVRAWLEVVRRSGTTTEEDSLEAAKVSMDQFAPGVEL
ncbi:SRPBCC family protein [Kribbella antibiotica]|uniref:SRPBCC family protein n=1 Tax=Kribbella antibiotica TaxID=190195 RepID=A0A4R4ZS76_9ACTN|nr:SRPBCC family protein [Kribbella antibiotica]TDD60954.1 SRPBCC family protein [Kribbella antibiotica]